MADRRYKLIKQGLAGDCAFTIEDLVTGDTISWDATLRKWVVSSGGGGGPGGIWEALEAVADELAAHIADLDNPHETSFLQLIDTPDTYTGAEGMVPVVSGGELIFAPPNIRGYFDGGGAYSVPVLGFSIEGGGAYAVPSRYFDGGGA